MLTPQNAVQPNAVIVPNIVFNTRIKDGKLVTTAVVSVATATVDEQGHWEQLGGPKSVVIPDVTKLPDDLAALQGDTDAAMTYLITLIGAINAVRKVV